MFNNALLLVFLSVVSGLHRKKPFVSSFGFPSKLTSGQRVIITCSVLEGEPPIRVIWLKDARRLSSDEWIQEVSMGSDLGSSLVFRRVAARHSGLYSCFAFNEFGNSSFSARMEVRVGPSFLIEPPDHRSAIVGENVRLDCQADGFPVPVIRWKLKTGGDSEFRPLSSNYRLQSLENGSLALTGVAKGDEGLYLCEATNGVNDDISRELKLSVHLGANFKKHFELMRVRKDDPIVVECEAFGEKPLRIKWTRDSSDVTLLATNQETEESLISRIRIESAQRPDSSLFTCLAINPFGQSEATRQVVVVEVPDPPLVSLISLNSKTASFEWKTVFDGNQRIEKFVIHCESRVLETRETSLTLNDLTPDKQYLIRVRAINQLGSSEARELSFRTEEESPSSSPTDVSVTPLSSSQLKVMWKMSDKVKGFYVGFRRLEEKRITFNTVEFDNQFVIQSLERNTQYLIRVQAFNNKGAGPQSQEIVGKTFAYDAPDAPQLFVQNSSDVTLLDLKWSVSGQNPVSGFRLFSRAIPDEWSESSHVLSESQRSLTLSSLECGKHFQFYLISFNSFGLSKPSTMVSRDLTKVSIGIPPKKLIFLQINSTRVDLRLNTWRDTCHVQYFRIHYKPANTDSAWTLVSERVAREATLTVHGLHSGVWYRLLVSAHFSQQIFTQKEYLFSTLTSSGGTLAPMTSFSSDGRRLSRYLIVLIPISCAVSVLFGFVVIYICLKRTTQTTEISSEMTEMKTKEEQSVSPLEQIYDNPQKLEKSNEYQTLCECHSSLHY